MYKLNEYIKENKKILEGRINYLKYIPLLAKEERRIHRLNIERIRYYIKGLEEAKKYILEEEK